MNQENEALLNQGVNAVRAGNKREGARILAQVVRSEPQSDEAWFWLAAATDQPGEAKACLDRVLKINPNHTRARQALDLINQSGGTMPPTSAFTGEAAASPYGTPPPPPVRPLSTNELISPSSSPYGGSPYGAPTTPNPNFPPPPPFGSTGNVPPPPPFGATGNMPPPPTYGATMEGTAPPPPPFGAPAWAQDQAPTRPTPMPVDPYSSAPTTPVSSGAIPPPPSFGAGRGVSYGQLDPNAAAASAAAVAEEQAGPKIYDPGAEIRRSLLGDPPVPPAAPPPGMIGAGEPMAQPAQPPKKPRKRNNRALLLIVLAALVLLTAAVFAWRQLSSNNQTTTATVDTAATQTAAAAVTTGAATTPSVSPAGAATTAAVTTAAVTTNAAVVTTPATTAAATTAAATTAAAITSAAQPATTAATTAAAPAATPTAQTPRPTVAPGGAITIPVPQRTPTLPPGANIPPEVQQYLNSSNILISQLTFLEAQLNTLVIQPYKTGKIQPGVPIAKTYEVDYFTFEVGIIARQFRELVPPAGAAELHLVGLDYANDLLELANNIDFFFNTGRTSYLDTASSALAKAGADRTKWNNIIQGGYPFKVV